jgi:hypothetical protein
MLCILYVIGIGAGLSVVGLFAERVLLAGWSRRWLWCAMIAVSLAVPGFYRVHHNWSVTEAFEQQSEAPARSLLGKASLAALDPGMWAGSPTLSTIINRVWLTASALLLLWLAASWARVAYLAGPARNPTIVDGIPVTLTQSIGPATVGFWRSRVLVPRWVLTLPGSERRYVLRHEEEHRRAHDAGLLLLASLTLLLTPWNVALWWQLRRLRLAVEMDCDNRVVAALGDAPAYGSLLLRVAEAASRGPRLQPAFLGGMGTLERRLRALLDPSPAKPLQRFALPALAIALLILVLSTPHPVLNPQAHVHDATVAAAAPARIR